MKDEDKTKEQLIDELVELRQRVAELEAADTERKWAEEELKQTLAELEASRAAALSMMADAEETRRMAGQATAALNMMVDAEEARRLAQQANEALKREIAERKRAEEALKRTMAELERSNKELEQFAYVASHDLQEPLRMVSSYVQLLARRCQGQLDSDADDFIAFAMDGANRMRRLINDLLTYSRVGTRGKEFAPTDPVPGHRTGNSGRASSLPTCFRGLRCWGRQRSSRLTASGSYGRTKGAFALATGIPDWRGSICLTKGR